MSALLEINLPMTDPRVDVAYQHLKRCGHLVPKADLAIAMSHAMQAELRAFEIEHKGIVR